MRHHLLSALLLSALLTTSAAAENWAEKMFETTRHDFGSVARGAKTEFEFVIKNIYLEDVHIASVRTSCSCTRASIKNPLLKTYEEGAIVASINTPVFRGRKPATITVVFDRPQYAEVRLQSDVFIRSDVAIEPGVVELGTIDQGSPTTRTVSVSRTGRSDWQIVEIRSTNPHIRGEAVQTRRDRSRVSYELTVRLDGAAPSGYLRDHLVLVTNDRQSAEVPVPVEGLIQSAVTVSPASLFMGVVEPGQKVTKQLVIRGKRPFRIKSVRCEDASFEVAAPAEEEPKSLYLVPVTFVAGGTPGKVLQKIQIETDLGEVPPGLSASAVISE